MIAKINNETDETVNYKYQKLDSYQKGACQSKLDCDASIPIFISEGYIDYIKNLMNEVYVYNGEKTLKS